MRLEIRDFRIPVVLTILMVVVLANWAWMTWQRADEHAIGRRQHQAFDMSDILMSALIALEHDQKLDSEEIERRFETILAASPYQFFILEQDGKRLLQVGKVPAGLPSVLKERAFIADDVFYFSRNFGHHIITHKKALRGGAF